MEISLASAEYVNRLEVSLLTLENCWILGNTKKKSEAEDPDQLERKYCIVSEHSFVVNNYHLCVCAEICDTGN